MKLLLLPHFWDAVNFFSSLDFVADVTLSRCRYSSEDRGIHWRIEGSGRC
jgi:hypothetical protein